ncbi:MAG: site-specific integrase [Aestuariibacter sp.]|nr:site-specific integrase [Aestuariibacter sp.]
MSTVSRPPEPPPRTRRPTEQEIKRLILASGYDYDTAPETIAAKTAACFLLAIETAMRAGEICALEWKNVHTNHVHLPMTKNGTSRDVPLSSEAKRIINQMGGDGLVWGITTRQLDANFRKLKKRAVIDGLTFHDSRREALTRLANKLDVMELAKVSGHKDLKILLQVYYAPTIGDLANKLD